MVRVDMSEYMEKHSVSKMIGSPPGYVGHDDGGQLSEKVRRNPYSVVLFDEIEKAHPSVLSLLLQIFDNGYLTDSLGRKINFRNTYVIMTSNAYRASDFDKKVGFVLGDDYNSIRARLNDRFPSEFLNRIDDIIHFQPLKNEHIRQICELQMRRLQEKMKTSGISLAYDDAAIDFLSDISFEPQYGARPVKRAINNHIINGITMKILSREIMKEKEILVSANDEGFLFSNIEKDERTNISPEEDTFA
jgi:ATP-dependent Clp protease ATP-binding subunit ClpB